MNLSLDRDPKTNQRGSEGKNSEPRFLVIGQIVKPHGVKGEVSVVPHTDLPERFSWLEEVYLGDESPIPVAIEAVRFHKGRLLLKLAGYDSREQAQELRGKLLQIPEDQAIPLEEGEYFLYQLIDLLVETTDGVEVGILTEIIETGANNVFVVQGPDGVVLIPDIPDVVSEIDFDQKRMIIQVLPGLLGA